MLRGERLQAAATHTPSPATPCSLTRAIRLIDDGQIKGWRSSKAPGLASAFYALPVRLAWQGLWQGPRHRRRVDGLMSHPAPQEGAPVREALLRMRADEACIHHLNVGRRGGL